MQIRPAKKSDLEAITAIYNDAIETTVATLDTEPKTTSEQARWFREHTGRFPILIAEVDGNLVGWSSISPWSGRCGYDNTGETSFYVHADHRGAGIGKALKRATIERARALGFHSLIAQITDGSDASRHINERFGYEHVGTFREVGRKFGRLLDVHLYQLLLD